MTEKRVNERLAERQVFGGAFVNVECSRHFLDHTALNTWVGLPVLSARQAGKHLTLVADAVVVLGLCKRVPFSTRTEHFQDVLQRNLSE